MFCKTQSLLTQEQSGQEQLAQSKEPKWKKVHRVRRQIIRADRFAIPENARKKALEEKEKLVHSLNSLSEVRHWMRDKNAISNRLFIIRCALAIVSTIGTCVSLIENEMVVEGYGTRMQMDMLKTFNTASSILCVVLMFYLYWVQQVFLNILRHIHSFRSMNSNSIGIKRIFSNPMFYLECFLVGVHCPPGLDYQYGSTLMGNFTLYRIETVFSSLNLLRIYLVWRTFEDWMLADLPKRHTLAGFNR
jgi:hypothetical protein